MSMEKHSNETKDNGEILSSEALTILNGFTAFVTGMALENPRLQKAADEILLFAQKENKKKHVSDSLDKMRNEI